MKRVANVVAVFHEDDACLLMDRANEAAHMHSVKSVGTLKIVDPFA